jgi:hypothetical protein
MIGGIGALGAALVGVLMLVGDFLFGAPTVAIAPAIGAIILLGLWVLLPLRLRHTADHAGESESPGPYGP